MTYFWRVLHYLRPYWKLAFGSVIITIASAAASLLMPWPLKLLVDNVLGSQPIPPILTGLSSGIAQTLVDLGVDLGSMRTVGDLQGGLEEAERLLGYCVIQEGEPVFSPQE